MCSAESRLVDIVRDFLLADRMLRRLFERHARGELRFDEVREIVGDAEGSVLFRLKERCHALFRPDARASGVAMRREALFDLAVGSLFHEAMKLRENLYQRTVYGPRVRALRSQAGGESAEIFDEFEKILAGADARLVEAREETEALLHQTRAQFRVLLATHRKNGLVTRYLIENEPFVAEVFEEGLDGLLAAMHDSAAAGYELAARSYLASGYFAEARRALGEAVARGGDAEALRAVSDFAEGMEAYLAGRHAEALTRLGDWLAGGAPGGTEWLAPLAHAAAQRVARLAPVGDALQGAAASLAKRLEPLATRS